MSRFGEKNVAITGIGQSEIYRKPQVLPLELAVRACERAIADAGLRPEDIDGASVWPHTVSGTASGFSCAAIPDIAGSLGLKLNWWSGADNAAQMSPIMEAIAAISAGYCKHVLCWRAVGERWITQEDRPLPGRLVGFGEWLIPYHAYSAATWVGIYASTHMARYGITREQMGAIPIVQRKHASLNPKAVYRDLITMDDYLSARMISTPLTLFDCDVPCDGTTAVIISRVDAAKDLRQKPVLIEAVGAGAYTRMDTWIGREDYPHMAFYDAAKMMWSRTDLKPKDIDTAHLYDGFTWLVMSWLEALGICGEGESGAFIEGGHRISLDGELPLNTNGGQLSEGRMHGFGHLHEAVLQLRGQADQRQVAGAKVSVVGNGGGSLGGAVLLRTD
ncbi:MAG TPA: thiolase family protein [Novosphingobium sp.]|nr:thiolase family protein [Novosphingobium sp.]